MGLGNKKQGVITGWVVTGKRKTACFTHGLSKCVARLRADRQDRRWQWQRAAAGEVGGSRAGAAGVIVTEWHPDKACVSVMCPVVPWDSCGACVCPSVSLLRSVLVWQFLILRRLCSLCLVCSLVMFCRPSVSSLSAFSSVCKIVSHVQCMYVHSSPSILNRLDFD